jgi:hypothetical protein
MNLQCAEGFSAATGALGVGICEDKFRLQLRSDVVHLCPSYGEDSLRIYNDSEV